VVPDRNWDDFMMEKSCCCKEVVHEMIVAIWACLGMARRRADKRRDSILNSLGGEVS
jgi:hypothetical protein